MKPKTRILLVDDHSVVRMGLAAIINIAKDLTVCGEAENGEEAVAKASQLKPDVVVMDLMMPGMSGVEATAAVLKASPSSKVLILTTFGTSAELADAFAAGATGAITKNLSSAELAAAIRDTAAGVRRLTPEIAEALSEVEKEPHFTPRQREVVGAITRGLSNDDIATLLGISKARVKQHLNEVYEKLGAANRAEAVAIAMRRQLLKT
ncbi:MAG: response regulator transcription factor [Kiritimatiellae bacterium]|nr:response regulator transcription factor [Kiritimatiellia bacterium]